MNFLGIAITAIGNLTGGSGTAVVTMGSRSFGSIDIPHWLAEFLSGGILGTI